MYSWVDMLKINDALILNQDSQESEDIAESGRHNTDFAFFSEEILRILRGRNLSSCK